MPPVTVWVMVPVLLLKQLTACVLPVAASTVGCVIATVPVTIQPNLSVTEYVWVFAVRSLRVKAVFPPDHAMLYGLVAPVVLTAAVPVFPPKHNTLVEVAEVVNSGAGISVVESLAVQPIESLSVTYMLIGLLTPRL